MISVKLFLLLFVAAIFSFQDANSQVFIVNGRSEQGSDVDGNGSSDQRPFIVVAAASSSSENDADPNEAFIPTNDDNDANRPGFKLLTQEDLQREEAEDFEVIEAGIAEESGRTFIPTNDNLSSQPGFKLLSQEDLAREESQDDVIIVEVGEGAEEQARLLDIPRDTSGADQPFFKLPLPDEAEEDEYDDVVIIAASDEGRSGFDNADSIPRDTSDFGSAPGFKLPLPEEAEEDEYSDVEIIEADDEGRTLSDIPRDTSAFSGPGFKLPLPEEVEEDEYFDVEIIEADDNEGRTLSDIPRDESAADEAGPRLPKKIDDLDDVEIISVGNDVDCFEERDPGTCLNSHEAWFYDPTHNKCHFFIYSGCGGNSNRFFTEDECIGTCKDAKRTNKKKVVCPHAAPICGVGCVLGKPEDNDEGTCLTCICNKKPEEKQDVSICLEPARTGLCKAALKYWYYNADRQACEEFTYGGCEAGSSPNKFHTKVLCQEACQGVKKE